MYSLNLLSAVVAGIFLGGRYFLRSGIGKEVEHGLGANSAVDTQVDFMAAAIAAAGRYGLRRMPPAIEGITEAI
ncbi:hypothetical protein [Dongia sp.]|uniref:hypothetical protein n=1 Tax=Dongia sp. TaxID=1977262 RepID=UPI0035B3F097